MLSFAATAGSARVLLIELESFRPLRHLRVFSAAFIVLKLGAAPRLGQPDRRGFGSLSAVDNLYNNAFPLVETCDARPLKC